MFDAAIIGSGPAGLLCGLTLARNGLRVLILEKSPHSGGTSAVFSRRGYAFPMGPLGFSHPAIVDALLSEAGLDGPAYEREHYQVAAPGRDIMVSRPLGELRAELIGLYPSEAAGLGSFFDELQRDIGLMDRLEEWHPDFGAPRPPRPGGPEQAARVEEVRRSRRTGCRLSLDRTLDDESLKRFLGGMGSSPPTLSRFNLAVMWNLMSEKGIWSPAGGVHGLCDRLREAYLRAGGELLLASPAARIIVENGRSAGVAAGDGREVRSRWIVSTADAKTTVLELVGPSDSPPEFRRMIEETPYTGSELCVYAGIDPRRVDFSRMRARHLLWTPPEATSAEQPSVPDFAGREIEICRWSDAHPECCPAGRESLVFRTGFPYEEFAGWRAGYRERRPGYREMKRAMASALLRSAEYILPGLVAAVEVMEAATPLTYADWGNRFQGSIAGWGWGPDKAGDGPGLLVETPVKGLLLAGLYASTDLFLGGVPTALFCARAAAERVLGG